MKKVFFAAQNFNVGGVQTSLVNLLNTLHTEYNNEYDIDLFVFGRGEFLPFVPEDINIIYGNKLLSLAATPFISVLKSKKPVDIILRIILMIYVRIIGSDAFYRKMFERHRIDKVYDTAVSYFNDVPKNFFNQGTNLFVADFIAADEKVAWTHNDPVKMGMERDVLLKTYERFDRIMCVSGGVKDKFDKLVPEYAKRTEVCYNKFCPELIIKRSGEFVPFEKSGFNIVTVCRVDNLQKRVDGIVKLCKRLKNDGVTNFTWRIVGGGPDLKKNINLARKEGVLGLIVFTGEQINPYPYIKNSDLFALFSAYEGHPMVIGETQILGVNILTTNYAAAKEQIEEGKGIIADNDEIFYEEIKRLILEAQ